MFNSASVNLVCICARDCASRSSRSLTAAFPAGRRSQPALRNLASPQLVEDGLDLSVLLRRGGRANQHLLKLEAVMSELFLHLQAGLLLDRTAVLQRLGSMFVSGRRS